LSTDKPATKQRNVALGSSIEVRQLAELRALSVVTRRPIATFHREGMEMLLENYKHLLGPEEIERSPLK